MEYKRIFSLRPHHIRILEDMVLKNQYYFTGYLGEKANAVWDVVFDYVLDEKKDVGIRFVEGLDEICLRCKEYNSNKCGYLTFKDYDDETKAKYNIGIGRLYSTTEIKELIRSKNR